MSISYAGLSKKMQNRLHMRARARAVERIIKEYDERWETLLEEEKAFVLAEHDQIVAAGHDPETTKLRPGVPIERPLAERIRTDVGTCPDCVDSHDTGHVCKACGAVAGVAQLAGTGTDGVAVSAPGHGHPVQPATQKCDRCGKTRGQLALKSGPCVYEDYRGHRKIAADHFFPQPKPLVHV